MGLLRRGPMCGSSTLAGEDKKRHTSFIVLTILLKGNEGVFRTFRLRISVKSTQKKEK